MDMDMYWSISLMAIARLMMTGLSSFRRYTSVMIFALSVQMVEGVSIRLVLIFSIRSLELPNIIMGFTPRYIHVYF
jgi:hypothetical protein